MISPKQINSNQWSTQAAWFIDPVSGNDRNAGDSEATALKTWAEFVNRVDVISAAMTVTVLSNIAEPLCGSFRKGSDTASLVVTGTPTVLASGSASTMVNPDPSPAVNARGTVTVADLTVAGGGATDFTPYVGKLLRSPATDVSGEFVAPVLAQVAGVAQVPFWARSTLSTSKPADGALIEVLDLTTTPYVQIITAGVPVQTRYFKYTSTDINGTNSITRTLELGLVPGGALGLSGSYFACEIVGYLSFSSFAFVIGTLLTGNKSIYAQGNSVSFTGGGSLLRKITLSDPGRLTFDGFIIQGAGLAVGFQNTLVGGAVIECTSATSIGIFNAPGNAIEVFGTGSFMAVSPYGKDNVGYGLSVAGGARATITGTPAIVSATAGQDLRLDGAATAIPPLTAAGAVPAAANLTTWAEWAAPPFSRNVMSYTTGSRILGA